jgi:hypothetical protein
MKHTPFKTTSKKTDNLLTLAYYLLNLPKDYKEFNMKVLCRPRDEFYPRTCEPIEAVENMKCGAVACALGHGPLAGIKPKRGEDWREYSGRCFCPRASHEWEWCFGQGWQGVDSTPKGAAQRILYLLEKGLPENSYEQRNRQAFLSYTKMKF